MEDKEILENLGKIEIREGKERTIKEAEKKYNEIKDKVGFKR